MQKRALPSSTYFPRNLIFKAHIRQPLSSTGQNFLLQIQRSGFDIRRYQILSEVVGLERGPLSLVSTIEKLLVRKLAAQVQKSQNTALGDPPR
jgi:hypothetical protein